MSCTLFKDGIRNCQLKFSLLVKDVPLDFCYSNEYHFCPFYKIIVDKDEYCENLEECGYRLHRLNSALRHDTNIYKKIMYLVFEYCLSTNKESCERLKLMEKGKKIPNSLLQDGSYLKSLDFMKTNHY